MFSRLLLGTSIFFLSSCVSSKFNGYLPVDTQFLIKSEYHIEGSFLPSYDYHYAKKLAKNTWISISSRVVEQELWISFDIGLGQGATFQLSIPDIRIEDSEKGTTHVVSVKNFTNSIMGTMERPGSIRTVSSTDILIGDRKNKRQSEHERIVYRANTNSLPVNLSECITLFLPEMVVNNRVLQVAPITFMKIRDGIIKRNVKNRGCTIEL